MRVVSDVAEAVELAAFCCRHGLLARRSAMFVLLWVFTGLVFVILMSRDMAVIRRARTMLCGVACGWKAVVALLDCLRRFLFAFFERVCGFFFGITRWG